MNESTNSNEFQPRIEVFNAFVVPFSNDSNNAQELKPIEACCACTACTACTACG